MSRRLGYTSLARFAPLGWLPGERQGMERPPIQQHEAVTADLRMLDHFSQGDGALAHRLRPTA